LLADLSALITSNRFGGDLFICWQICLPLLPPIDLEGIYLFVSRLVCPYYLQSIWRGFIYFLADLSALITSNRFGGDLFIC